MAVGSDFPGLLLLPAMSTGVLEAEAMKVAKMYERTKGRVLIEHMMLTEFKAKIGLRQRSALNRS